MDSNNPASLFFDEEEIDLYAVLSIEPTASQEDIKKAYRKLALIYHPDKHATAAEGAKFAASRKFQQVGFAYAVLSEKNRRAKYDATGSTEEGFELAEGEDGWQAYFEALFESVTKEKLDQMKKEYQGMVFSFDLSAFMIDLRCGWARVARRDLRSEDGVRRNRGLVRGHHESHPPFKPRRRGTFRDRHLGPDRQRGALGDGRVDRELEGRESEARSQETGQ